jgi:hypothetical protein
LVVDRILLEEEEEEDVGSRTDRTALVGEEEGERILRIAAEVEVEELRKNRRRELEEGGGKRM